MAYFLAKTDPETYSIERFASEKETVWDGVRNAQAVRVIQAMNTGDKVLIYHSKSDAAIVGLARVTSDPRPAVDDARSWVVDMAFVRQFQQPVTLKTIKETHLFDDWSLIRQSRLSTMAVPDMFVAWFQEHYPANTLA
ncbi:ubiquinol-cytochrome c reductase [Dictyobacter sp. S3.2.2.5]|uniref:Ubiquinol-cytochrome c reductase n=1 Tax=Dictyobacter halimunensis TaxID=3026934 RepID=A0ABQ6FT50_9CHLR|nr:ubiquinol-cytochrome c reductase [Dictyobacter sp. S3.2.2.5]